MVSAPEREMTATDYANALGKQLMRSLIDSGHSACRYNTSARYDFDRQMVICGCGHEVPLTGQQPPEPPKGALAVHNEASDPLHAALQTIDPTRPYSPVDLEMRLLDVLHRLETGAVFERKAIENAASLKAEWERAYYVSVNASQAGSADKRKAEAYADNMELYQKFLEAEMLQKAVQATMHNLRGILSGYQSVARSVGLDYQAGGANR